MRGGLGIGLYLHTFTERIGPVNATVPKVRLAVGDFVSSGQLGNAARRAGAIADIWEVIATGSEGGRVVAHLGMTPDRLRDVA